MLKSQNQEKLSIDEKKPIFDIKKLGKFVCEQYFSNQL